jgi:hypothetical protein
MDIPIPEICVQVSHTDDGTEEYGVVDGQQRLRTILQFIGLEHSEDHSEEDINRFALDALPATSDYRDQSFAGLTPDRRRRFFEYELNFRFLYTEDRR